MEWSNALAIGNFRFWEQLLGAPQTVSKAAGGHAEWTSAQGKTFLGRPVPFTRVVVRDSSDKSMSLDLRLPLSARDSTRMQRVDVNLMTYNTQTQTVTVSNDNMVGLVALLLLTQRLQLGSLASNAVFGAYISLSQGLRRQGDPDMGKIRTLYQEWYDRLGPASLPDPPLAARADATQQAETRERFALGMRRREHLGSVAELVSTQRFFDKASNDGLLQRERFSGALAAAGANDYDRLLMPRAPGGARGERFSDPDGLMAVLQRSE
jgi:hypothetical protein